MSPVSSYLANPLWLAPMAGVTDRAFRTLCLRHGAGLAYTEMVSAAGLHYGGSRTAGLYEPAPEEGRIAVQLFGSSPELMAEAAERVAADLGERLAFIDVNMGCPVRKVAGKGEGAALMKTPELACEIVSAMVSACPAVPITAKFRSGWEDGEQTAPDFARRLEDAGASLLAVHGRSARQMYSGKADWGVIARVKEAVNVPVAGSGDVFAYEDAVRMRAQTGADAVLVARGARGNPWIFEGREPTQDERVEAMREHLELYCMFEGQEHLSPLRAQLSWYVRGLPGAAEIRRRLSEAVSRTDFERVLAEAGARAAGGADRGSLL